MDIGFILVAGEAILTYKTVSAKRETQKIFHLILHSIALVAGIIGVYAVFKFHNEISIPHMYTLHSWIGMSTLCLFGLQDIALGRDIQMFMRVATYLLLISLIGCSTDFLTLGYIIPALYERFEDQIDRYVLIGCRKLMQLYVILNEKFLTGFWKNKRLVDYIARVYVFKSWLPYGWCLFDHIYNKMRIIYYKTYVQSLTVRLGEWRLKRRDTEERMRHCQLPEDLKQCVRRYVQYKWLATREVDEEAILHGLPADLRRDIQRHLCLDLVRREAKYLNIKCLLDLTCQTVADMIKGKMGRLSSRSVIRLGNDLRITDEALDVVDSIEGVRITDAAGDVQIIDPAV